jgi:hypothetical protein
LYIEDSLNGAFTISVGGDRALRTSVTPTFLEIQNDLTNLRGRGGEGPLTYRKQEPIATRIGETLFKAFFPGPIKDRFNDYRRTHVHTRLALHLPHSLFAYPWEILKDPKDNPATF